MNNRDGFIRQVFDDFVFADCRLGSHPLVQGSVVVDEQRAGTALGSHPLTMDMQYSLLSVPLLDGTNPRGAILLRSTKANYFSERHLPSAQLLSIILAFLLFHRDTRGGTESSRALGTALRQIREMHIRTQVDLAEQIGIRRLTFSLQELGVQPPSRRALYDWCVALELLAPANTARVQVIELASFLDNIVVSNPDELVRLTPNEFERFIAGRLDRIGFDVTLTGSVNSKDGGIDLIAVPKIRGVGSFILAGQVKHHRTNAKTGRNAVDRLLAWQHSDFRLGMLVTNTEFTRDAKWVAELANNRPFLRLRDFQDMKRWIQDDFTSEHDWREIPNEIELAPGIVVEIPKPKYAESGPLPQIYEPSGAK